MDANLTGNFHNYGNDQNAESGSLDMVKSEFAAKTLDTLRCIRSSHDSTKDTGQGISSCKDLFR
jgi:hypothetical protein